VEELVGHGLEQAAPAAANRARRGHHRAVAVLHAVAVDVWQIVRQEGVESRLEIGKLAEDQALWRTIFSTSFT
jgi:hypothetical protein